MLLEKLMLLKKYIKHPSYWYTTHHSVPEKISVFLFLCHEDIQIIIRKKTLENIEKNSLKKIKNN